MKMNMNRWLITIVMCLAWIEASGCLRTEATPTPGPPPDNLFTEELLHYQVVSAEGTVIGLVDGLEVGTESAKATYVVVRLPDKYAFGKGSAGPQDRFLMIPWTHLKLDTAHHQLIADVNAAVLREAPFSYELPNRDTPAWETENQRFWTEQ